MKRHQHHFFFSFLFLILAASFKKRRGLEKNKNPFPSAEQKLMLKKVLFFGKANNFLLAGWLAGWGEAVTKEQREGSSSMTSAP